MLEFSTIYREYRARVRVRSRANPGAKRFPGGRRDTTSDFAAIPRGSRCTTESGGRRRGLGLGFATNPLTRARSASPVGKELLRVELN